MTYYCSPRGSDSGYSILRSGSFHEMISKLLPGDTLHVLPGVYNYDYAVNIFSKGTADNPIYIIGDDNDRPVFDFRYQKYGENGIRLKGDNLVFKNIIVRYAGFKGVRSDLSNSVLENIETYGCCDSGLQMASGGNNKIIHCISHDNFGYMTIYRGRVRFGFHSDGISDKLHNGDPNVFIDCESYNNSDDGFDFYGRVTVEPTILRNCKSYNNGKKSFDMSNHPRYEIDKEWFDQVVNITKKYKSSRLKTMSLSAYPAFGNGDGFKLGGNCKNHNVNLYNCSSYNNRLRDYDRNTGTGRIHLYDCRCHHDVLISKKSL